MGVKLIHLLIHTQSHVEADPRAAVAHHRSVHVCDVELAELYVTNMDGAMMGDGGARVRLDV